MKPGRRLGEPMIAAVSFYLLLEWVVPVGAWAAQADSSSAGGPIQSDQADQAIEGNRIERSDTDGSPVSGLFGSNEESNRDRNAPTQQAGQASVGSAAPKAPQAKIENEAVIREAQNRVAPHSMLIESSLRSAQEQVEGLKAQLHEAEVSRADAPLSADQLSALKSAGRELASDLDTAQLHRTQLREGVLEFPGLSESKEFRAADRAFTDLFPAERAWQDRMARPEYWQNRSGAVADLAHMQERIRTALSATERFNRVQLNLPESTLG